MIRPLAALTRQVQQFFLEHLVGVYRWDDVKFAERKRNINTLPENWKVTKRGKRIRPDRLEGRYHAVLEMQFGDWDLVVEGPNEHPPLGWVMLTNGDDIIEGTLDSQIWPVLAQKIKQDHTEKQHGTEHRPRRRLAWG